MLLLRGEICLVLSAVSYLPGGKCRGKIFLVSSVVLSSKICLMLSAISSVLNPVSRAIYNAVSNAIFIAGIIPDSSAIYNAVSSAILLLVLYTFRANFQVCTKSYSR